MQINVKAIGECPNIPTSVPKKAHSKTVHVSSIIFNIFISPQKCPFGVHSLMFQCWNADRGERPSFAQITIVIDRWIRSPETMDDEADFFITIGKRSIV